MHYPYIGLLALVATDTELVRDIVALYKELSAKKMFNGVKELAFTVAIQKQIQQLQEVKETITLMDFSKVTHALEHADLALDTFQLGSNILDGIIGDLFN